MGVSAWTFSLTWSSHSHRATLCPSPLAGPCNRLTQALQWGNNGILNPTATRKTLSYFTESSLKGFECRSDNT